MLSQVNIFVHSNAHSKSQRSPVLVPPRSLRSPKFFRPHREPVHGLVASTTFDHVVIVCIKILLAMKLWVLIKNVKSIFKTIQSFNRSFTKICLVLRFLPFRPWLTATQTQLLFRKTSPTIMNFSYFRFTWTFSLEIQPQETKWNKLWEFQLTQLNSVLQTGSLDAAIHWLIHHGLSWHAC